MSTNKFVEPEHGTDRVMGVEQLTPANSSSQSSATLTSSSKPSRAKAGRLASACLNLPPAFFSLNMGTGITSILLHNLPYNAGWLQRLGIVIFVLNILIFVLLVIGNLVRYVRWKGIMRSVNTHPLAAMFWGCLPMGFATIVVGLFNFTGITLIGIEYGRVCVCTRLGLSLGEGRAWTLVDRRVIIDTRQPWRDLHDVSCHFSCIYKTDGTMQLHPPNSHC